MDFFKNLFQPDEEDKRKRKQFLQRGVDFGKNLFKQAGKKYEETTYTAATTRTPGNETLIGNIKNLINPFEINPIKKAQTSVDLFKNLLYGEPETYKTEWDIQQASKQILQKYKVPQPLGEPLPEKLFKRPAMTPKEKKIVDMAGEISKSRLAAAAFMTTTPMRIGRLKMDTKIASEILGTKAGATEAEVSSAYRDLIKKEYPRTVEELAKKSKTTAAKIVTNARDFLINEYQQAVAKMPKPQLPAPVQPEVKPIIPAQQQIGEVPTVLSRLANEPNKTTFTTRGGTWVSNELGLNPVRGATGIAGQIRYEFKTNIKNPLVIKNAELEDGSFAILNSGYENFISKKYVNIATTLYEEVIQGEPLNSDMVDTELMNALYDAGIKENVAMKVLNESKENKFDAAMDLIMSKALKEAGYDSLILKGGDQGDHVFIVNEASLVETKPEVKVKTVKQLEKTVTKETYQAPLRAAGSQEEYVKRANELSTELTKPEVRASRPKLRQLRALANEEIKGMTGYEMTGNWKRDWSLLQTIKQDPELTDAVSALEDILLKVDEAVGNRTKKAYETVAQDLNLPAEGKFHIPYGKYTTHGTGNIEWVRQNIPLLYMGNKQGMVGYILDVLGVKQKDLPSITGSDVTHLKDVDNVVDLFGGSGLLSNLSKRFFPAAQITYNELDSSVLKAIEQAKKEPQSVSRFISEIAVWLDKNPKADWLSHFSTVYKGDPNFMVAARLIEGVAGRVAEVTPLKLRNLLKAVPNFSKTFKDITVLNKDAWGLLDHYIAEGTSKDFLWVDPPYLWSTGYQVGAEMERTEGFLKLLGKLEKLNEKGVKFVFFNNDPEVQVAKAGLEAAHLDNIVGRINQLSEEGMVVVKGIDPLGAGERREMMITNLDYGLQNGRLLNLKEVRLAIEALRLDPAAAPKEVLKMYRDIRGTSRFVPEGQRISPQQIRTIRTLRSALRIKNREMIPMLDELLGDTSFAKMTKEDGIKMIEWLQPRNWSVIEKKIELTKKMLAEERQKALLGDKFVAKDTEFETKYGVLGRINQTVDDIDNFVKMVDNLPPVEVKAGTLSRIFGGLLGNYLPEREAAKLLGIRTSFQLPMARVVTIGKHHERRMKTAKQMFKDLTPEERKQAVFLSAGAKKYIKGKISDNALRVHKYFQEIALNEIHLINRLREAVGQAPLVPREPYISYIVDHDLMLAANLFSKNKFWKQRIKTPKDFAVGLFEHDPERIIDAWSESSGNWLSKNLYAATMMDRFEATFKVSDGASAYARQIAEMDIYNILPEGQKMLRSVGAATNEFVGSIFPKKVPVDEEQMKSILNTTWGQELKNKIKDGYIEVPRVEIPNVGTMFHKIYYPAKLAWNFGFYALNRTQPMAGLPFVGPFNKLKSLLAMHNMLFPWNKGVRQAYVNFLEESGYEFGRLQSGQELPSSKQKVVNFVDRSVNFLGDISEFQNRIESMLDMRYFLESKEGKAGIQLSTEDKMKVSAQFSGFINFLAGKGYAPVAQRSTAGRFVYVFTQYPLNQFDVYHEMIKVAFKEKGVKELLEMLGREGGASPQFFEYVNRIPKENRAHILSHLFMILAAVAIPIATLYALSRSWNVASRALPGMPRVPIVPLVTAVFGWMGEPTDDKLDTLKDEIKKFFDVVAFKRAMDALAVSRDQVLQVGKTQKPVFVDKTLQNISSVLLWGRSSLPEYEKRFPSFLGRILGGYTEAGEVRKLQREREALRIKETQDAVDLFKLFNSSASTEEITNHLVKLKQEGRLTDAMKDKVRSYYEDQATGKGGLETSISNLKDEDQATFILDQIFSNRSTEELTSLLSQYKRQGILTENVKSEIKRLLKEGKYKQPETGFGSLFGQ